MLAVPASWALSGIVACWVTAVAAAADVGPGQTTDTEEASGVDILSFFVLAILMGVVCLHLLAWTKIPYTALLLVGHFLKN